MSTQFVNGKDPENLIRFVSHTYLTVNVQPIATKVKCHYITISVVTPTFCG